MGKRDLMISLKVYIIIDLRNTRLIHLMMWFTEKENMSRETRPNLETLERMQVKLDIGFCARRKFSWQCPANPFSLPLLDPVSFFRSEEGNSYLPNSLSVVNLDGHKLWHSWHEEVGPMSPSLEYGYSLLLLWLVEDSKNDVVLSKIWPQANK